MPGAGRIIALLRQARRVPRIEARRIGEHCAAFPAGAFREIGVERADHVFEALLDVVAPEIDLVQLVRAGGTEPGAAVELVRFARPLDDQADRAGRPARRVVDLLRQDEHLALVDAQPLLPPVLDHVQEDVAVHLVEDLVERVDVEIVAGVRTLDDLEDEVRALEHLLVADRAQRVRQVPLDPAFEVEGCLDGRHASFLRGPLGGGIIALRRRPGRE